MIELHNILEYDNFILYGGAPLDLLINPEEKVHDFDVAIAVNTDLHRELLACQDRIKAKGFELLVPEREYFINITERVLLIYAKNGRWFLDIGFLKNPELIGLFDIGSIYCQYPELDVIDTYGAVNAYQTRTIKPVRGLDSENPYLLAGVLLKLCAKYDVPVDGKSQKEITDALLPKLSSWNAEDKFHGTIAKASSISAILKSILIASNRKVFISGLANSKLLTILIPEIQNVFLEFNRLNNASQEKILSVTTKKALIEALSEAMEDTQKDSLQTRLGILKSRIWSPQDVSIAEKSDVT